MILGENGIKMGKRYPKFVVNPSDIVKNMEPIHFVYMKCLWVH